MSEDYEILPHQLLSDLKNEIEALKKKLLQPDAKMEELILEMESLKDSLHELQMVFQKALEEMKEEDLTTLLKATNDKLTTVVSQNETIAKGMIAISDKLEDFMQKQVAAPLASSLPPPVMAMRHTMGMPPMSGPGRVAPPLETQNDFDLPPPPPGGPRKRVGLFT